MPPARSARSVAASGLAGWLELSGGAGPLAAPNAVELDVPDVCRPAEAHLLYARCVGEGAATPRLCVRRTTRAR